MNGDEEDYKVRKKGRQNDKIKNKKKIIRDKRREEEDEERFNHE